VPELTRRDGVELARSGVWDLSTGIWRAEPGDFAAAIAATTCPAVDRPYLRLGHSDPRFPLVAEPPTGDGEPAIGWIDNLRVADGGNTLVGDWVEIPDWLNSVAASAYPRRSVEGAYNRRCALGHTHPFVLDGLALLGVTRPGVGTLKPIGGLDDVRRLFAPAVAASSDEVRIAASIPGPDVAAADGKRGDAEQLKRFWTFGRGGIELIKWQPQEGSFDRCVRAIHEHVPTMADPEGYCATLYRRVHGEWPGRRKRDDDRVAASDDGGSMPNPQPSLADRVREAWNASGAPFSQHVHQVRGSTAIVLDEADRSFWRIPVVVVDGGDIKFGERERVMPDFVDFDESLIAASITFATREESRPSNWTPATEVAAELDWRMREGVAATVLDSPSPIEQQPPNPIQPVEPPPPATPPTEEEPQTPPDEGGVPVSTPEQTPGAEPEQEAVPTDPEGDGPVSTLSTDVRSRLGLAEDVDDAAVVAALDALKQKAETPPQPTPEQVAASAASEREKDELRKEVQVLASQMQTVTAELAAAKAEKAAVVKASIIQDAIDTGRITPADRERWEKDYDDAPAVVTRVIASFAPYSAVPLAAAGYTGTGEEATDLDVGGTDYNRLFGIKESA
jgi:hypothetical protein